jgi:glycosyltransferase involved in cell wall biosynthesis
MKNMKLVYLAQTGLFDEWAHTVQILKMCEAFAENNIEVVLVAPNRKDQTNKTVFDLYGIKPIFKIILVPYLDFFKGSPNSFWYWIRFISFLISARILLFKYNYDVLYTRELYLTPFFRNVFLEIHSFSNSLNMLQRFSFKVSSSIVVLTSFIKTKIINIGINQNKILVAPDAVRLEDFNNTLSKEEARNKVGLKNEIKIFGYIGTLRTMGMEKGVSVAIDALKSLNSSYYLYIVGGTSEDIDYYKKYVLNNGLTDRVIFAGRVSHKDIAIHISACDVLVAPFPENEHYKYFMSPLKIFEYMASKRPMVVSDLPSLHEVLVKDKTSVFVPPNNSKLLAEGIVRLVEDVEFASRISDNAYMEVKDKYTWKKRAEKIIYFIKNT